MSISPQRPSSRLAGLLRGALGAMALVLIAAPACRAEDSDRLRSYLHVRGQDTNPLTGTHDAWGVSLGVNLNRYLGLEISADTFERFVEVGGQSIGEYGILALVPQLRLRYPMLDDRLVPYVVGGVGLGHADFNDRKRPAFGVSVDSGDPNMLVGTLGAGLEYFFADNMAVGVEVKYIAAGDRTFRINGVRHDQQVASLLTSLGLRMFVPELRPAPLAESRDAVPTRVYLAIRAGGAIATDRDAFSTFDVRPEPPAYFGTANQLFGAAVGVNVGRTWGVEMTAEGYEVRIAAPGLGSVTEYAVMDFVPHLRLRYPLLGGRLVPYVMGGVGLSYAEANDRKPPGGTTKVEGNTFGVALSGGAGIEYFVASNIAVGVETRYVASRGHTLKIGTREEDGNLGAVLLAFTLRAFLLDFGK